ncbi:RNA polymerase sigma factor [Sediminibacterium soli]|uniref:RNA polymerase sigma factor n=1 Tax=Sediminibacterium soli TaxID=2698829 RepID=UPI00137B2CAC|nr:RNA polymerase sigma factor [Sediminibacterium soli]NCI45603.1 RNA polymerase sigma factor [Sediminibacterium soli]
MELLETITTEEMVDMCKNGDPAGFTGLYNRYAKEVYNSIYRLVGHTAEAEDVLQESFVAAFQAIGGYQHTGGFRAWVKRIAINKSVSLLRKKKVRMVELEPADGVNEEAPIDEHRFSFTVEKIQQALEQLPDPYRRVFQLYVIENIPQVEIAEMLGIANNTVRIQYHRAKQKILNLLKENGYHG